MLTGLVFLTRGLLDNEVRNAGHKVVTTHSFLSSSYTFELCLTISVLHNGIVHRMKGKEDILKSVSIDFPYYKSQWGPSTVWIHILQNIWNLRVSK